jgi:AAA15 family ATPase/GTPase
MKLKNIEINSFKGLNSIELTDCGRINAIIGKNNSGKSSILHAIHLAGLGLNINNWNNFELKIEIKDLFAQYADFNINITYEDDSDIQIRTDARYGPIYSQSIKDAQKYNSILILPDTTGTGLLKRPTRSPRSIIQAIENRNFLDINALEMLYAIKYYATRNERDFKKEDYTNLIEEIKKYFPDIEDVESDRTDQDIPTLKYTEYKRRLDILYSGGGLKHFLDVLLKTSITGANIVLIDEPEAGLHPDLQRQFIEYLHNLSEEKDIQVFMATHSPILLNYANIITYYRITNRKGNRCVYPVPKEAIHTLLSDLGVRPSDIFNQDICVMVEGASDVILFEHIIQNLYKDEFRNISIGVIQYGGSAAEGIISRKIDVSNIVPAQKYVFWIRDRDAKPDEIPSRPATKFKNRLESDGFECYILKKREIEYYYPEIVHTTAQQGDKEKEKATLEILKGDQSMKYCDYAGQHEICVPSGKYLRNLLSDHVKKKEDIDDEITKGIIENHLLNWKKEILAETESNI